MATTENLESNFHRWISYDYDQLQNVEIVKGIYQKCEVLGIVGTKIPK